MAKFGRRAVGCGTLLWILVPPVAASASQIAYDSAGDSAYNNGFTQGSNGGYGWGGAWSISALFPPRSIADLGDSATNGLGDRDADGDINSPRAIGGRAWALNGDINASRPFAGPLAPGQTFSLDFDNGINGSDVPRASMVLQLAGAGVIGFQPGLQSSDYELVYGNTVHDTRVPVSYDGVHVAFSLTPSGYDVSIVPYLPSLVSSTIHLPELTPIDSVTFRLIDDAGFTNSQDTLYFNNIQITPEPAYLELACLGLLSVVRFRRTAR